MSRLVRQGLVSVRQERVDRDPFEASPLRGDDGGRRSAADGRAGRRARRGCARWPTRGAFGVALLHGVTGSGKTELYLRLSAAVRAAGRRVLMLVPEIALTPAIASLFRQAFGDRVAIQHSGLSDGERHDQWQRIRRGDVDVVVGTRSAVFAPLPHIGLIIVDEEHDALVQAGREPALQRPRRRDRARRSGRTRSSCSDRRRRRWRAITTR